MRPICSNLLSRRPAGRSTDVTEDQVAVAWLLRHPARIVPLLGTVKAARLTAQAHAVRRSHINDNVLHIQGQWL